ncbi:hypothetical protein ScPMuIL_009669 [Solemya velum]
MDSKNLLKTNLNMTFFNSDIVTAENVLRRPDDFHCSTGDLMGPLGLFVQGLLAFLAFTSLIVKRFCEPVCSRRPGGFGKFYDTSKQALGAAVIHFANVFLAGIFQGDPCTWYIVSFLLDSTIGLFVIYIGLKITQCLARKFRWDSLLFGEYGSPAQCNAWVGQCALYILVMIIEKILMTLLIQFNFWKDVRKFIMSPVEDPKLELIIVMFIVPLIVNAFIFWVVDNFLKRKIKTNKSVFVNERETAMKYYKDSERVKFYKNVETAGEFETDVLLLEDHEEDSDSKQQNSTTKFLS